MIPLILAGIGIAAVAYLVERTVRHKKVSFGGLLAASVIGGATSLIGGPVLDSLLAAPLFATEGAVAGEAESLVVKPVESLFDHFFHHSSKKAPADTPPSDATTTPQGGYAGSSDTASEPAPSTTTEQAPVEQAPPGGNDATMPSSPSSNGGSAVTPNPNDDTIGATYTVQPGDTFYSIAKRAHVTESSLLAVNPTVGADMQLRSGQVIDIPCPNIDTAGPGAPKSPGCAAAIEKAFASGH